MFIKRKNAIRKDENSIKSPVQEENNLNQINIYNLEMCLSIAIKDVDTARKSLNQLK